MSVLVIGSVEERKIKNALEQARANPVPLEVMKAIADGTELPALMLKDRKAGVDAIRNEYPSYPVRLGTYLAAISFEYQPAGLMRHLSVSSRNPKAMPGLEVMIAVCEKFGFSAFPPPNGRVWVEEFEPKHMAVNVIEVER